MDEAFEMSPLELAPTRNDVLYAMQGTYVRTNFYGVFRSYYFFLFPISLFFFLLNLCRPEVVWARGWTSKEP